MCMCVCVCVFPVKRFYLKVELMWLQHFSSLSLIFGSLIASDPSDCQDLSITKVTRASTERMLDYFYFTLNCASFVTTFIRLTFVQAFRLKLPDYSWSKSLKSL